ncbi:MAG: N-acetylglucosamine-6-phosphate deacetylase [Symbiobacteriaceae bacterium]|nr:N-acetylglucosamine-6-phosphate deacetylase [Symbiobacteriaceae bacterium]
MPKLAFLNARIITPEELVLNSALLVDKERILGISPVSTVPDEFAPVDLQGCWLAPGFIDIHLHGAGGVDALDGSVESIRRIALKHLENGTTSLYPTLVSATPQEMRQGILAIKEAMNDSELSGRILGVHLEGPFLNPRFGGSHDLSLLRNPKDCRAEWQEYLDESVIKLITLAPELPGSEELVRAAVARGITIAIGHSGADYEAVREARTWGVNQCSHLFNAMLGLHQREPGTAGSVLALESFYAQFIADGIHLHPALLSIIARIKGSEKGILISDAISSAGMPDGEYPLGGRNVILKDGVARTQEGNLAGSSISLCDAVRTMVTKTTTGLQTAVQMATLTPARAMGIESSKGSLNKGRDADLVVLNDNLKVLQVWSRGKQIR